MRWSHTLPMSVRAATILAVMAAPAQALGFKDGHDLLEALNSDNQTLRFGSIMFVSGVFTAWETLLSMGGETSPFCGAQNLTRKDVADMVRIWLRGSASDDLLNESPENGVLLALHNQFGCE